MSGYLIFKINNSSFLGVGGECPLNHDDEIMMIVVVCYELGKHLLCTV